MKKQKNFMQQAIAKTSSTLVEQLKEKFSDSAKLAMEKQEIKKEIIHELTACGERVLQAIRLMNEGQFIQASVVMENAKSWLNHAILESDDLTVGDNNE